MLYWRQAGLNYIQYSNIAAKALRRCVQENAKKDAMKREEAYSRITKWVDGKAVQQKTAAQQQ